MAELTKEQIEATQKIKNEITFEQYKQIQKAFDGQPHNRQIVTQSKPDITESPLWQVQKGNPPTREVDPYRNIPGRDIISNSDPTKSSELNYGSQVNQSTDERGFDLDPYRNIPGRDIITDNDPTKSSERNFGSQGFQPNRSTLEKESPQRETSSIQPNYNVLNSDSVPVVKNITSSTPPGYNADSTSYGIGMPNPREEKVIKEEPKDPATGASAPWFGQDYENQFSISNLRKKIAGVNYLSKFYFRFPEIQGNRIEADPRDYSELMWIFQQNKDYINVLKNLYFYSENITIPMRGINTDPHVYANGFRFEAPTGSNYGDGDIAITMMLDNGYILYDFFMNWMNTVHDKKTGYFNFHNRYTTDIEIFQLRNTNIHFPKDETFENMIALSGFYAIKVSLGNCYPKSVSAIEFKHEARDERTKITVNFTYEKIDYEIPSVPDIQRRLTPFSPFTNNNWNGSIDGPISEPNTVTPRPLINDLYPGFNNPNSQGQSTPIPAKDWPEGVPAYVQAMQDKENYKRLETKFGENGLGQFNISIASTGSGQGFEARDIKEVFTEKEFIKNVNGKDEFFVTLAVVNAYKKLTEKPNLSGLSPDEAKEKINEYLIEASSSHTIVNEYIKNLESETTSEAVTSSR